MNGNGELVERIVTRVARRLQAGGRPQGDGASEPTSPAPADNANAYQTDAALLGETVITAALLEQQLNGQPRITVRPEAILTPSARDFLKTHGIECRRQAERDTADSSAATWKALVVASTLGVQSVLDDLRQSGDWSRELAGDASDAVERAVSALCRGEADGVAVFAADGHAIACRANRNRQVRAAVVHSSEETERVAERLGANLICVDPHGQSYFQLRNILRAFTTAGRPQTPVDWAEG